MSISFNVSEYYSIDGLTAEERIDMKKAVDILNKVLENRGDKIILSQIGYRTCLNLELKNVELERG